MNSKQFLKLLIVVAVLGLAGWYFRQSRQSDWKDTAEGGGKRLLAGIDINKIAGIHIKDADGELDLLKQGKIWVVKQRGGYPANYKTVVDFVWKLEELGILQQEPIGASALARMQVNEPGAEKGAGVLLALNGADGKPLKSYILGKEVMKKAENNSPFGGDGFAAGRWLIDTGNKESIISVSETLSDADSGAKDWLNKDFFKVDKLKTIAVTHTTNSYSWTVNREKEGGDWKLAGLKKDEETDPGKLSAIGNPLGAPNFQDVVVDAKDADLGLDKPITVKLTTFDGFTYDLSVGKQNTDNDFPLRLGVSAKLSAKRVPAKDEKPEDKEKLDKEFADGLKKLKDKLVAEQGYAKWTYTVTKWTLDSLFKERKDFIAEKVEVEPADAGLPTTPTPLLNPPPAKKAPAPKTEVKKPAAPKPATKAAPVVKKAPATKTAPKPTAIKAPTKKAAPKPAAKADPKTSAAPKPVVKTPATKSSPVAKPAAKEETAKPTAVKKAPEAKK
jgi:hypothetical protein